MSIEFSKTSGILKVSNNTFGEISTLSNIFTALHKINTTSDELGPYLIPKRKGK